MYGRMSPLKIAILFAALCTGHAGVFLPSEDKYYSENPQFVIKREVWQNAKAPKDIFMEFTDF